MNFMQFCHQKGNFSTLNLRFAYFVRSKMSIKGIIMFLGMNNTRLERKILMILDFENRFLPTYLPLCDIRKIKQFRIIFASRIKSPSSAPLITRYITRVRQAAQKQ